MQLAFELFATRMFSVIRPSKIVFLPHCDFSNKSSIEQYRFAELRKNQLSMIILNSYTKLTLAPSPPFRHMACTNLELFKQSQRVHGLDTE